MANIKLGEVTMTLGEAQEFLQMIRERLRNNPDQHLSFAGKSVTGRTFLLTEKPFSKKEDASLQNPHLWSGGPLNIQEPKIQHANRRDTNAGNRCPSCFVREIAFDDQKLSIPEDSDQEAIYESTILSQHQQFSTSGIKLERYRDIEKARINRGETPFYAAEIEEGSVLVLTYDTQKGFHPKNFHGYLLIDGKVQKINVFCFADWNPEKGVSLSISSTEQKSMLHPYNFSADLEIPPADSKKDPVFRIEQVVFRIAGVS